MTRPNPFVTVEPCAVCGTTTKQPGKYGRTLHRFVEGERVQSITGMGGVILRVPTSRAAGRIGYSVLWDNGHSGLARAASLEHEPDEAAQHPIVLGEIR